MKISAGIALKEFELTIPKTVLKYIHSEIKKPKRANTELFELWLERELNLENPGSYGNLPTDESHVTAVALPNGDFGVTMSNVCFDMIASHVQPEPHSHRRSNEDMFHAWLEVKTHVSGLKEHIEVKEKAGN
jgi:hypothetical protein